VVILDVQLQDGTAWDVLDRTPFPHPPFRVALVSAVDVAPPLRWSHFPLYRKPLDRAGLLRAIEEAVPFESWAEDDDLPPPDWLERFMTADEPPTALALIVSVLTVAVVTLMMIPLRETAPGAIGAIYAMATLLVAAYAGMRIGLVTAVLAFLARNFFTVLPYYTFEVANSSLVLDLVVFLITAAIGAIVVGTGRTLARRRATDAEMSRLRLRLLAQTADVPSGDVVEVIKRVIGTSLSESAVVAFLQPEDRPPDWCPPTLASQAQAEQRTVEGESEGRPVLVLPLDRGGSLLAATTSGSRLSNLDRLMLGFAATELGRVTERLRLLRKAEVAADLEARDEAKNALLAAVSHDLRTPLASMKVAITTVLEPSVELDEDRQHRLLETVNKEVDRLGGMIDHLLDLSRLESGAFQLKQDQVDLDALVQDAVDRVRLASDRQIRVDSDGIHTVTGDSVRLLEVVTNLMDNAARYSDPASPIDVSLRSEEGSVVISITDQGPGMTEEEQEKLFRPFTRGSRKGEGSGLGLAITRSIVQAHGGAIEVTSSPGSGTTMSVKIPRRALE
jgi:two-component system sensor histidine kinase KdpD